jgi:hypothetical protein
MDSYTVYNKNSEKLLTYFASPIRSNKEELYQQIDEISINPVINTILKIAPDKILVLNENRQILTANHDFLAFIGLKDSYQILGLQLGDSVHCDYSNIMPGGCGTSKYCITCGAAISIVTATQTNYSKEMFCSIVTHKDDKIKYLVLKVKAFIINIENHKYIMLIIKDIMNE